MLEFKLGSFFDTLRRWHIGVESFSGLSLGGRDHILFPVYTFDMVYTVDTVYTVGMDIYHKYQKLQNTNKTSVCKNGEHHYWYLVPITHLQRGHWRDDVLYTSQN